MLIGNSLEIAIAEGEGKGGKHDFKGYFGVGFKVEGVDDISVDIVKDEEDVGQMDGIAEVEYKVEGPEEVGDFEEEPSYFRIHVYLCH